MKEIIKALQNVLNSEEIQNKYGEIFKMLSPNDKVKFQTWLIYKLAEKDENIRDALARCIYERLRAETEEQA